MQAQFLPDIADHDWYEIETLSKLDHTFLKINQTQNLFIKSHCKSNTLQTKYIITKQDLIA